ncbi:hypothetical protein G7Y89_g8979 [Cudoniella acicularis]|uniref:Gfo/Idh/MocA-like oxidoreductase N-terminal domain-containing protein n=1 Tax=Cudoniella acicularis TaxID=354080 RepID=A0A8H4W032_9HELO|nr:hypothetical protein G7Y89_g8979 [Cudoniella acicularis]
MASETRNESRDELPSPVANMEKHNSQDRQTVTPFSKVGSLSNMPCITRVTIKEFTNGFASDIDPENKDKAFKLEVIPAVLASQNLTLKAIYSRTLSSAQTLLTTYTNITLYSSDSGSGHTYHDLLLRPDIHAVILALPILTQPEFIEAALAAGKHVLSEKPIAQDVARAEKLIEYSKSEKVKGGATWAVAENFRFLESFEFAKQEIGKLGRVLGFRVKVFGNVKPGGEIFWCVYLYLSFSSPFSYYTALCLTPKKRKTNQLYLETAWRKKPEYQGGFLLDGGVHFVAGTRLLLGEEAKPTSLTAYTTLLQEHLPPVDTVDSVWQTASGISGTFSVSFGTTLSGSEYTVACEKGSVTIVKSKVTVRLGEENQDNVSSTEFKDEGSGVKQEVAAWAESLVDKSPNPKQSPEQALGDLEILEKMLRSGESQAQAQSLKYQV